MHILRPSFNHVSSDCPARVCHTPVQSINIRWLRFLVCLDKTQFVVVSDQFLWQRFIFRTMRSLSLSFCDIQLSTISLARVTTDVHAILETCPEISSSPTLKHNRVFDKSSSMHIKDCSFSLTEPRSTNIAFLCLYIKDFSSKISS